MSKGSKVLDTGSRNRSVLDAIVEDLTELNLNVAQIFAHGPRTRAPVEMDRQEIIKWMHKHNSTLIIHSAYVTIAVWKSMHLRQFDNEMASAKELGALGLVLHMPLEPIESIARKVVTLVKRVPKGTNLLLENPSSKPSNTISYPHQLNQLCDLVEAECPGSTKWGFCIDTAHLWACGLDISSKEAMQSWLDALTCRSKIKAFHLNGSMNELGSAKDVHAIPLGKDDLLWGRWADKPGHSGLAAVVQFCKAHQVPMVLEINYGSEKEARHVIQTIKSLHGHQ